MSNCVDKVIRDIIRVEGGYTVDHAGPTKYGITIPYLERYINRNRNRSTKVKITGKDIKNLTEQSAFKCYMWYFKNIYKISDIRNYDLMHLMFDCFVNHGMRTPVRWLQRAVGTRADGSIGPKTLSATNKKPVKAYYSVLRQRIKFFVWLSFKNPSKYRKFLKGWINRACDEFVKSI